MSEQELVEATNAARGEGWDDEPPVEIDVRPARTEVVSFRIPSQELDRLQSAIAHLGESLSEFVRKAVALRLEGSVDVVPSLGEIGSNARQLVVRHAYATSVTGSISTELDYDELPLFAPTTVQGGLFDGVPVRGRRTRVE